MDTMTIKCEYCKISGGYGDLIYQTDYWMVFLAPSQRYLGTCVVALKRHCKNLSELENNEWADFAAIVGKLEDALDKSFTPDLYNWSCFKNATFRDENPNPEVHWHFIPRYRKEVKFMDTVFEDPDFGHIPQPVEKKVSNNIMNEIMTKIKENLE